MSKSKFEIEFIGSIEVTATSKEEAKAQAAQTHSRPKDSFEVVREDPLTDIEGPAVELTFHPQEWVGEHARTVTPKGPTTWEVPLEDAVVDGEIVDSCSSESDALARHERAPHWVRQWSGPFYVEVGDPKNLSSGDTTGGQLSIE